MGNRWLHVEGAAALLFTNNETNYRRLYGVDNESRYVKDGIGEAVIHGRMDAVNPDQTGTKAAARYTLSPSVEVPRGPAGPFWPHFQPLMAGMSSPYLAM